MSKLAKALTAAAGNAAGESLYVEDVFSTYLYTGTGSAQTITNGIDLSGEGGLVWGKSRTQSTGAWNWLVDTARGVDKVIWSNETNAQGTSASGRDVTAFNTNGFSIGTNNQATLNTSTADYVSWTFRKAEKFFDVVTYTGNSTVGRTVAHSLGSVPGLIIVKTTNTAGWNWTVYHRSLGATKYVQLNTTAASVTTSAYWNNTEPTESVFTLGSNDGVNGTGFDYVAYLFASDAGGYGDDGSESIIKCGSYTGDGGAGTTEVNLGFEPQWILVKATSAADNWFIIDNMRGWATESNTSNDAVLLPNTSNAESTGGYLDITATGFKTTLFSNVNVSGRTYAYVAIRRPMKTPESGTEVFNVEIGNGDGSSTVPEFSAPFASDFFYMQNRNGGGANYNGSRLAGNSYLLFESTSAEASGLLRWDAMNGMLFFPTTDYIGYMFKRATGFMDVVAYTGDGTASRAVAHNLGVAPELMIVKSRSGAFAWAVYANPLTASNRLLLNSSDAASSANYWNSTEPTDSVFTVDGNYFQVNGSSATYIAYLFASVAGVSKVGSYTGTAADLNVDCGFSAGARWIMIKRTDSSGDWYVWDSARGIVAGNDPYLLLNSTAAEVTSTDYIDPLASGFTVTSSAPAALNASGGTYIFLAIA